MVEDAGEEETVVGRLCTDQMHIDLRALGDDDVGCIIESSGSGHMCFCREDWCNGAREIRAAAAGVMASVMLTALML